MPACGNDQSSAMARTMFGRRACAASLLAGGRRLPRSAGCPPAARPARAPSPGVPRRDCSARPRSAAQIVELRLGIVAELRCSCSAGFSAPCPARCTSTSLPERQRARPARPATVRAVVDVPEQRRQHVLAVARASGRTAGAPSERRERRDEIDLGDERVGDRRLHARRPAHDERHARAALEVAVLAAAERPGRRVVAELLDRLVAIAVVDAPGRCRW